MSTQLRQIDILTKGEVDYFLYNYWELKNEEEFKNNSDFNFIINLRKNKYHVSSHIKDWEVIEKIKNIEYRIWSYLRKKRKTSLCPS